MHYIRRMTKEQFYYAAEALDLVRRAIVYLEISGAKRAAAKVRTCRKSVQGAVRHAERCRYLTIKEVEEKL